VIEGRLKMYFDGLHNWYGFVIMCILISEGAIIAVNNVLMC